MIYIYSTTTTTRIDYLKENSYIKKEVWLCSGVLCRTNRADHFR